MVCQIYPLYTKGNVYSSQKIEQKKYLELGGGWDGGRWFMCPSVPRIGNGRFFVVVKTTIQRPYHLSPSPTTQVGHKICLQDYISICMSVPDFPSSLPTTDRWWEEEGFSSVRNRREKQPRVKNQVQNGTNRNV